MEPIKFKECNVNYVADGCKDLPVHKSDNQIISCWELSEEEIQKIIKNKVIWLSIWGKEQLPVCLLAETPFMEHSLCEECDIMNNPDRLNERKKICHECSNRRENNGL